MRTKKAAPVADPKKGSMAASHAAQGAGILSQLYSLASCESSEPSQLAMLNSSIDALTRWLEAERSEVGTAEDAAEYAEMYGYPMKAFRDPMKAEDLTTSQLDEWLQGKRPRGILVVPFGGPLPGGKAGLDLDGEYFDEETDLYGQFPQLRRTRERLVDWHHDGDPTGVMKGAILGRIDLDENPGDDGYWAAFWANAGEKRRYLMAQLEEKGVPLFGSSQAEPTTWRKAKDGHIEVWPLIRHTITTSPQNTYAVVPPLKAILTTDYRGALSIDALEAAMLEPDNPSTFRTLSQTGERGGTGGSVLSSFQEARLRSAISELERTLIRR